MLLLTRSHRPTSPTGEGLLGSLCKVAKRNRGYWITVRWTVRPRGDRARRREAKRNLVKGSPVQGELDFAEQKTEGLSSPMCILKEYCQASKLYYKLVLAYQFYLRCRERQTWAHRRELRRRRWGVVHRTFISFLYHYFTPPRRNSQDCFFHHFILLNINVIDFCSFMVYDMRVKLYNNQEKNR